jgi:cytochrome c peroxidase
MAQGPPPPPPPPAPLQAPPAPPQNPVTAAKASLGKVLFWEEQLSSTRTVACGTCHIPAKGGSDPRSLFGSNRATAPGPDGIPGTPDDIIGSPGVPLHRADGSYDLATFFGHREQVTTRKAPSSLNIGYSPLLFWDGRATGTFDDPLTGNVLIPNGGATESQIAGPPTNNVEMGHIDRNWTDVVERLAESTPLALSPDIPDALASWINGRPFDALFQEAFGSPGITPARIIMAIATYERTQFTNQAPIDLDRQNAPTLTTQEQQGRQLFAQNDCVACHSGNRLTDEQFHYTGVRPQNDDLGRFAETNNNADRGAMKTPGLRNVELHAPYMHNGRFATLEEVVEFYNRGGDFNAPNKDNRVRPRNMTQAQKDALVAFLKRPLTDPRVAAEQPPFDRPLLYTESDRVPRVEGTGVAGSGNRVPRALAFEPPLAGSPAFTLALENALGGATATLVIDDADPGIGPDIPGTARLAVESALLAGAGNGSGHGSVTLALPASASIIGVPLFGRWYVEDPGAAGGVAVSQLIRFTIFGDAIEEEGETLPEGAQEGSVEGLLEGSLEGEILPEGEGQGIPEGEVDGEQGPRPYHSADPDHDHAVSMTELLRCIQLYNVGQFQCGDSTEDGFDTGMAKRDCPPHASDYAPQDWTLSLSELLRLIQLFSAGTYHECPTAEDGFCPGE